MEKKLNSDKVNQAMTIAGLTQTAVAQHLGVTKQAVSQWLSNQDFPRPNKLLQLGKLLSLTFDELVIKEDPYAPVVAFRKMKGTKTKDHHIEQAQERGYFLRHLVQYLPFDILEVPPVLKNPSKDYLYIQKIAKKVRNDINVNDDDVIVFDHLISRFSDLQAVIIPVLWGSKQRHENAVHIFLPDSQTTWVYLNLDVNVHDFKFWMAHELGHCLSPSLRGDEAEDFADEFAGALLFPENKAKHTYEELLTKGTKAAKIAHILKIAENSTISPYTVYGQINKYAEHANIEPFNLEPQIHGAISNFNKKYLNLSAALFGNIDDLKANDYLEKVKIAFKTPFFDVLSRYLKEHKKGAGIIQSLMDISLLDAQSIYNELN
jgi:transcriptional regulator with XRE-family HTH domain